MADETKAPSSLRVILAEDDELQRGMWRELLEREGFEVRCFEDGLQLSACLCAAEPSTRWADAVVTDVDLPGLTGLEAVERARQCGSRVPVLVVTGAHHPGLRTRVARLGGARLLTKPVNVDVLVHELRTAASGARARR